MNSFLNNALHTLSLMGCAFIVICLVCLLAIRMLKSKRFQSRQNLIFGTAVTAIFSTIIIGFFML